MLLSKSKMTNMEKLLLKRGEITHPGSTTYITSLEKGSQIEVTVNSKCRRDTDEVVSRTIVF